MHTEIHINGYMRLQLKNQESYLTFLERIMVENETSLCNQLAAAAKIIHTLYMSKVLYVGVG